MKSNVVYLHGKPQPVGHYVRVGSSGHRQLEALIGAGDAAVGSFVIDASSVSEQQDLISLLRDEGRELILDTKVAELSVIGRFDGRAKRAPWAQESPLGASVFSNPRSVRELAGAIARFAVRHRFNAVLAPSHLIDGPADPWLPIDQTLASELRSALDREGGHHIGVDYNLIWTYQSLREADHRKAIVARLRDTPFDNLWLRTSKIGSGMTAPAVRRYIEGVSDFGERPVVADQLAGLSGLAAAAFGVLGGLSHGVCEKERFDGGDWHKPRSNNGGGREHRILVASLDKLLTANQIETIMAAPHARRTLSCSNPACCPKGLDDMMRDPKRHYMRQRVRQIEELSRTPEGMRITHFRTQQLANAVRVANQAAKLRVPDDGLRKMLIGNAGRLDKMQEILGSFAEQASGLAQSPVPIVRTPQRGRTLRGGR